MFLPRDKIQYPSQYEADQGKLQKRFNTVKYTLPHRSISEDRKSYRDKKCESDQIKKMDHFFLPTEISAASTAAR